NDRILTLISQHFTAKTISFILDNENKALVFLSQLTALITIIENSFKVKVKDIDNMIKNHVLSAMLENSDYTSLKTLIEQALPATEPTAQQAPEPPTISGSKGAFFQPTQPLSVAPKSAVTSTSVSTAGCK
ncbi:MAG: hypothetical protein Q8R79_02735, partial [Legionellaceae bacterium]|nr:hypothetical protein [Legionellaceae bacterium]